MVVLRHHPTIALTDYALFELHLEPSVAGLASLPITLGQDHALATALWDTGIPDARIVAGMVAEPARLTSRQMDAWARDFASWDVCDQVCGSAFLASPLAWRKVPVWAGRQDEFVRRAAFALLATLAVHLGGMPVVWVDNAASNAPFMDALNVIEAAADDERNFVKKAVNWALRNIGKRNQALNDAAIACARRIQLQGSHAARRSSQTSPHR